MGYKKKLPQTRGLQTEPPVRAEEQCLCLSSKLSPAGGPGISTLHPGVGGVFCTDTLRSPTRAALTHPATKAPAKEVCDDGDANNHDGTSSPLSAPMTYQGCSKHFTGIQFKGCYYYSLFIDEKTNNTQRGEVTCPFSFGKMYMLATVLGGPFD